MRGVNLLGRLLLTALLLFLILVAGFYSLYAALFALDGSDGLAVAICLGLGGGTVGLLIWWIVRLWHGHKKGFHGRSFR